MDYIVTEQYARGEEKRIAEFDALESIEVFLAAKLSKDEDENKLVIYRVYEDSELIQTINLKSISTTDAYFNQQPVLIYQVRRAHMILAQFNSQADAMLFITSQLAREKSGQSAAAWLLFKNNKLIDSLNQSTIRSRQQKSRADSREEQSNYTLSPLSTRPTPSGPPDYWVKRNDEDDDNCR